jgi:hypothetical protein
MSSSYESSIPPAQLSRACAALAALGALLACADPSVWNSLARPLAADLAQLMFTLHGEVTAGLKALGYRLDS